MGVSLASCEGEGCVTADEFDTKYIKVDANPMQDGVYGGYDDIDGGQVANWHSTGLRTSNEDFIIMISGGWVPWRGWQMTRQEFADLKECNICAKKENSPIDNCICFQHKLSPKGKHPRPERGADGKPVTADCTGADQDDPRKCSCTTNIGRADDYGVYHFALNYYDKDQNRKLPDDQDGACKYSRGLGLYLGVFGKSGNDTPIRTYHLFSEESVCPIATNAKGECVDENGYNRTKYIFRSRDQKTFVSDDNAGNDGSDLDPSDDEYYGPNEYIKLIIYDRFYSDNYGYYNVEFLKGVFNDDDIGLLEYLVRIVEDSMMGDFNENGEREGGVLEFLYNAIAKDSNFLIFVQLTLVLYVAFFGASTLLGLVEMNKKEIYGRILKIAVVIFFTNPDSWHFYNQIVVGFFKDGMDSIVDMVTSLGEIDLDKESNPLVLAQLGSSTPGSTGSRFSYVDTMLRTLFSDNVTKKVWGLFFYDVFGFLYIILIYGAIFYFLYVMLVAATVYAVTLTKLIFALALGPIFFTFFLFKYTQDIFKKWIAFLAARSLEIIILFLLLYTLVGLVDQRFNELLYYSVCHEFLVNGYINIKVLKATGLTRTMVDWLAQIGVLGITIFMSQMIFDQIPTLAGALISVGGVANQSATQESRAASGFALARGMASQVFGEGRKLAGNILSQGGGGLFRGTRAISRASGLSGAIDKAANKASFGVRGIRSRVRDAKINKAISKAKKAANSKGLTGTGRDEFIRNFVMNDKQNGLLSWKHKNKGNAALLDMSNDKILSKLDKELTQKPLQKYIKNRAKELKKQDGRTMPLGKDMVRQLKADARAWADKNLSGGAESIEGDLKDMKGFINKQSKVGTSVAAKRFSQNDDLKIRYLNHLKEQKIAKRGLKKGNKSFADSSTVKRFLRKSEEVDRTRFDKTFGLRRVSGGLASKDAFLRRKAENLEAKSLRSYLLNRSVEGDSRKAFTRSLFNRRYEEAKRDMLSSRVDRIEYAKEIARQYNRSKLAHLDELNEIARSDDWNEVIERNGGKANYRDGLIANGDTSLFEDRARMWAVSQSLTPEELAYIDGQEGEMLRSFLGQDEVAGSSGLQGGPVEFGASISDALVAKEADIGLKAGSVVLGSEYMSENVNVDKEISLGQLSSKKTVAENKIRNAKMNKQMAQLELSKLEDNAENKARISSLKQEISQFEETEKKESYNIASIDSEIKSVNEGK